MKLTALDWSIVVGYLVFSFGLAAIYIRRASRGMAEFFVSGRSLPWWLLGTSMVATTFSTDTPNLVTDLVRDNGVAHNWVWWAFLVTGMMTVFFYARLWRRSQVLTDLEFYEIRYSGKSAAVVRGFRAIYLGFFFNIVIMATVTLAAAKIANILFGWSRWETVIVCAVATITFSVMSGLWGVVVTDLIQFIMAMTGSVAAAYYAVSHPKVGGLTGLVEKLEPSKLNLLPDFSNLEMTISLLVIPLAVQWWSVWYPGAEPGGGSYIAQRMLAAKDEKHSMAATLWFNVAHYGLRPWPWVLVALASMLVYPEMVDIQQAFPHVSGKLIGNDIAYPAMLKFLPHGLLGVMVASLMAAYISTMDTHLNWGASYLVHDLYKRFIRPVASEKHYVLVARIVTAVLMLLAAAAMFALETAKDAFNLLLSIGAGTGLIYLLRWFWWRINAWSEIAAMVSSFIVAVTLSILNKSGAAIPHHVSLVASVVVTSCIWLIVTYLTSPTDQRVLVNFYKLVRPFGIGWKSIRDMAGLEQSPDSVTHAIFGWLLGITLVYSALFCAGYFLFNNILGGVLCLIPFLASVAGLSWLLPKFFRTVK
ncbi:MAG: sodium:solute symporter family protein [bacterium]|nr:sodium:solute symporter family protein [bacterium]